MTNQLREVVADALLPCPFCGLDVTDDEGCFPLNHARSRWEVRCGNPSCFAHEATDETREAAIARWNRRATLPTQSAGVEFVDVDAEIARIEASDGGRGKMAVARTWALIGYRELQQPTS